ncbi:MAG: aspartyl/asparaginyl beta-hydroxylase protein [Alphaproteobacteria bacterium]|nr:aspartyl/asparaginyl beta-hydroxylase protein [Alphaproteobacteria bacterium]
MDEAAVDRLLAADSGNVEALLRKGDLRSAAGDDRAAVAFYKRALGLAAGLGALPMSLKPAVARAQAGLARAEGHFARHLEEALAGAGFPAGRRPPRFQDSLDLLSGRRQVPLRLQQPTSYYYPGLPQRRYYERSEFAWAPRVEAAAAAMREELRAFFEAGGEGFTPYVVSDPTRPRTDFHGLTDNPAWSTLYLWEKGAPVEAAIARFPDTFAAVKDLDLPQLGARAPSILFSRLQAGARIPAHHGVMNARLICHLPLIVPAECGFCVGGETRAWREGELLVFDDTVEHQAWNGSDRDRIILIFDVWRPELGQEERRAIAAMFAAIDDYSR